MKSLKGKVVLVVEDEAELRGLIAESFLDFGCITLEAEGAYGALELIKQNKVDIIISDVRMPKGDGIELLKAMAGRPAPRPIHIMMTGYSGLTEKAALELGASALIQKPFRLEDLFEAIGKKLEVGK